MIDFLEEHITTILMFILMLLAFVLIVFTAIYMYEGPIKKECISEDVDCDGEVTVKDLLRVQKYILEKSDK